MEVEEDQGRNPTLARILRGSSLPSYREGEHYRVVSYEGGTGEQKIPIFTSAPGSIKLNSEACAACCREEVKGVEGGFIVHGVLSPGECDQIVKMSEAMGYTEDAPVSLARDIRQNESCVWVMNEKVCEELFERVKPFLPGEVAGGSPCGLNARWRLYKYNPEDIFRIHFDGSWPGSGLDDTGGLVKDAFGDRWSQLTIVFYLNDDFEGGKTRFFFSKRDRSANSYRIEEARPGTGGALLFFHGDHPLSPRHEGGFVSKGTKYIVRTDVLYMLPTDGRSNLQEKWIAHHLCKNAQKEEEEEEEEEVEEKNEEE